LLAGVGFPGHFMVKAQMPEGDIVIDPFNHGRFINDETCRQLLDSLYQHEIQFHPSLMMVVNKRQILTRMLTNLKGIYLQQADLPRALAVIDRLVLLTPEDPTQIRDRGIVSYGLNQYSLAYQDLRTYLHYCPTAQDAELIREYLATIRQRMSALN
jgi:regulator of sirC expression with transglutaminase-like and TPR domain